MGRSRLRKTTPRITIYHTRGPFENVFGEFSKRYPAIKVVSASGRGGELISRIMAERRAGRQGADVYLGAPGTPMDVLYPAKALEPIQSIMILPEVKKPSNWFRKQHHYADPENKYVFVFEGVVRSDMAYNTKLVDSKEVGSYWDLVKPKWKGKIAAMDPKLSGFPSGLLQFAYYSPELGVKFLRQLFGEMDITHPSATKVFVNWLLSKDGQTHYQKEFLRIDPIFPLREDVPADPAFESYRPKPGDKFMPVYRPEFRDLEPAFKVIEEAVKR